MSSLFSFTGLASGIDTASIVSALVKSERMPITRLENEQSDLGTSKSRLEKIRDLLNELKSASEGLSSFNDILAVKATSSQEDAFSISAVGEAPSGNFDVRVVQEALAERTYSSGFASKDQSGLFGTGTLSITVGGDATVDIAVDGSTTLDSLAKAINQSNADVTAGVMFDGTSYRLMVTGNRTGETDGAITFSESGTTIGLDDPTDANQYQAARSAIFEIDGFSRTSESNVVEDALPGVTLTLLGATNGVAKATLSRSSDELADKLKGFVDKYNDAYRKVTSELVGASGSSTRGPLASDSTLRTIQQRLGNAIVSPVNGLSGSYSTLAELGLSTDRTGTLSFDHAKLDKALAGDPEGVAKVLMNDSDTNVEGVMARVTSMIDVMTDPTDGMLSNRLDGINRRTRDLDDQIARMQVRLDKYESQLNAQFTAMETAMSQLQGQSAQLNAILGGLR